MPERVVSYFMGEVCLNRHPHLLPSWAGQFVTYDNPVFAITERKMSCLSLLHGKLLFVYSWKPHLLLRNLVFHTETVSHNANYP